MLAAEAVAAKLAAASAAVPETKVRLFKIVLLGADPMKGGTNRPEEPGDSGATAQTY